METVRVDCLPTAHAQYYPLYSGVVSEKHVTNTLNTLITGELQVLVAKVKNVFINPDNSFSCMFCFE